MVVLKSIVISAPSKTTSDYMQNLMHVQKDLQSHFIGKLYHSPLSSYSKFLLIQLQETLQK